MLKPTGDKILYQMRKNSEFGSIDRISRLAFEKYSFYIRSLDRLIDGWIDPFDVPTRVNYRSLN